MADVGSDDLVVVQRAVFARVAVVAGLGQVARRERIVVDDDQRTLVQHRQADLEGGRVECHQYLGGVAGRRDRAAAEVDLVRRDAERRANRGPNFRRIIRKRGEIGARQRR